MRYFKELKFLIKNDVGVADVSVGDVGVARFGKKMPCCCFVFFLTQCFHFGFVRSAKFACY